MYYHNGAGDTASSMRLEINSGVHVLHMGIATGSQRINDLYHIRSEQ